MLPVLCVGPTARYLTSIEGHSLRLLGNDAEKNEDLARDWRKLYHESIRYEGDDVKEDDVAATSHHLGAVKTPKEF